MDKKVLVHKHIHSSFLFSFDFITYLVVIYLVVVIIASCDEIKLVASGESILFGELAVHLLRVAFERFVAPGCCVMKVNLENINKCWLRLLLFPILIFGGGGVFGSRQSRRLKTQSNTRAVRMSVGSAVFVRLRRSSRIQRSLKPRLGTTFLFAMVVVVIITVADFSFAALGIIA